jgi:hypothetical protein
VGDPTALRLSVPKPWTFALVFLNVAHQPEASLSQVHGRNGFREIGVRADKLTKALPGVDPALGEVALSTQVREIVEPCNNIALRWQNANV